MAIDRELVERMATEIEATGTTIFPSVVGMSAEQFGGTLKALGERLAPNDNLRMETVGRDLRLTSISE